MVRCCVGRQRMSDLYRTTTRVLDDGHSHVVNGTDSPCVICGAEQRWVVPATIDHEALARGIDEIWSNTDNTVYDCAIAVLTDEFETAINKEKQ